MKTKGFIAFLVTALQHLDEKLSLALGVKFSHQQPQKYTDHAPNSVVKGILDNFLQTPKMSDPLPVIRLILDIRISLIRNFRFRFRPLFEEFA